MQGFPAPASTQAGLAEGSGPRVSHSPPTLPVTQRCPWPSPVLVSLRHLRGPIRSLARRDKGWTALGGQSLLGTQGNRRHLPWAVLPYLQPRSAPGHAESKDTRSSLHFCRQGPVPIPFSALVYRLLLTGLGPWKAEATVPSAAVSPARTWMKQAEETNSQEQGRERVQIPALARLSRVTGAGASPPVPVCELGAAAEPTPISPGRPQVLSNRVWNLTGPRGKLGEGSLQMPSFLPQGFSCSPTPSLHCTGRAPRAAGRRDTPAPTTLPCLGGSRGSWL